jgi:pimeloyl-ACP methyl ester carboxylesterase
MVLGAAFCVLAAVLVVRRGDKGADEPRRTPGARSEAPFSGGMVDVGGRRLYLDCVGSGSPTVVLEAGSGGSSEDWTRVVPALSRTTRTCAYDRAGLGQSDPAAAVRDAGDDVEDLQRLLARARIKPPYVLVGHSYGALLVRLFAHAHPGQIGGVVLVDAVGRDWWRRGLAAWPKSLAPKLRGAFATRVQDGVDVRASGALDRRVRTLGDTRLIVITAARQHDLFRGLFANPPARLYRNTSRGWRRLQTELAKLSRDSAHVVALRSDHFVADDDPDVVVEAVEAVTRATRQTAPLPPCGRIFAGSDVRCLS